MANLLEVLVTSDSNNTLWTCCVWDAHTGTSLMTYKGGGTAESKTLTFIENDYIVSAEKAKPILHIWPLNSHQTVQGMRFILPGKASALDITQDGSYCIAGIDEKIYLWQMTSGSLLTIINRHYQKVGLLKFTSDGRYFISAAEDGMVMVWSIANIAAHPEVGLVTQSTAGQHDPVYIFSDHSLPVTGLIISKAGMNGRLCTVSYDRSCKTYDLATGEMLLNLVFDVPLHSVAVDVLELNIFVGTTEGKIHQFSLTNPPRTRDMLVNVEQNCSTYTSHTKAVTCLSVSLDGETLMSASNDERVILWHIKSRQPIRIISHKGPITNAFFTVNFPAIYKQTFTPTVILHTLERTLEKDSDFVPEIEVLINKKIEFWPELKETQFHNNIVNDIPSQEEETNYERKENKLKKELEKLKAINSNLYAFSVQKTLDGIIKSNIEDKTKINKHNVCK